MDLITLNSFFLLEPSATPPYQIVKEFSNKTRPFPISFVLIEVFPLKNRSLFNKNLQFRPDGKGMQFRLYRWLMGTVQNKMIKGCKGM